MRKGLKRALAMVMAAAMTIGVVSTNGLGRGPKEVHAASAPEEPAIMDSSSQVNYSTILGRGVDYGIVAENFQQRMHMQTTYAVNNYSRTCADKSTIDLIPRGSTAQILVGAIDYRNEVFGKSTQGPPYISIDGDYAGTINIEGGSDDVLSDENAFFQTSARVIKTINPDTGKNIERIKTNVFEASANIQRKIDEGYAINYKDYYKDQDPRGENKPTLDLTNGNFAGKVVYVDVDNDLLQQIGESGQLHILKDTTTVVVFNITDSAGTNLEDNGEPYVEIDKYFVSVDNGETWASTNDYSAHDDDDPVQVAKDRLNDKEICQKIIWNIRSTSKVSLAATSGLFIAPNSPLVEVLTTSAGWIVAENFANTAGEWHYIYHGGNQDVLDDNAGEIHFAARKGFTHKFDGKGTVEDTTVYAEKETYEFKWFENDENFSKTDSTGPDAETVYNTATDKLQFPKLSFYSDENEYNNRDTEKVKHAWYIPKDTEETFYFTVKETGTTNPYGIEISRGKIDITLKVVNNNDDFEYYVATKTYLDDGSVYKENGYDYS